MSVRGIPFWPWRWVSYRWMGWLAPYWTKWHWFAPNGPGGLYLQGFFGPLTITLQRKRRKEPHGFY